MNKLEAIEILKREQNGRRRPQDLPFFKFPEELRNDPEVAREAVKAKGEHFNYLGKELRKSKELLLEAAKEDGRVLYWTSDENLKKDKEFLRKYVQAGGSISSADEEVRNDDEFMLEMIAIRANTFGGASDRLQTNKDFIRQAVKVAGKFEPELAFEGREETYYNYSIKDLLRPEIREDSEFMQELEEIEEIEKEQIDNIAKMVSDATKEKDGFIDLAYRIVNNQLHTDVLEILTKDVSDSLSMALKNARNDEERDTVMATIGFLENTVIHIGPDYEEYDETNYLSGYTSVHSEDFIEKYRKDCIEKGKVAVSAGGSMFIMGEYLDSEEEINEDKYFAVSGIGTENINILEISKEECLKGREHHSIDEIEQAIGERTSDDISKVSNEIVEEMRDDRKDDIDK